MAAPADRRVRRTQQLLQAALVDEVLEKGYEHVSIQDVTTRADVGYRTFFRHYDSLDDLLLRTVESKVEELNQMVGFPPASFSDLTDVSRRAEHGEVIFQFIQDNQKIFRVVLLERGTRFCLEPIFKQAQHNADSVMALIPEPPIPPEIAANHLVASAISLLTWWLTHDMPYNPSIMGEIFRKLILESTLDALIQVPDKDHRAPG
jgi:AcrR family transcriptional regulator